MRIKASIIAIGSELLAGQIINRNSAWISAKLGDFGIDVTEHLTVDDIEADIVRALDRAAQENKLIFLTGGLGPTSDDLTRQAVASWADELLEYDEPSWEHIKSIFALSNRDVPETNRQQCYFPASATVLTNSVGTANGFSLERAGVGIFVLPGPPREVETIWLEHVAATLKFLVPEKERRVLRMWRTIGIGESHLAEMLEPLIRKPGIEVAYRAHAPYVETKLRFPRLEQERVASVLEAVEKTLKPWIFERDTDDVTLSLARVLNTKNVVAIHDAACKGELAELLGPCLREAFKNPSPFSLLTTWDAVEAPAAFVEQYLMLTDEETDLTLVVAGFAPDGTWAFGVKDGNETIIEERQSPYPGESQRSRNFKAVAALVVKAWNESLALTGLSKAEPYS